MADVEYAAVFAAIVHRILPQTPDGPGGEALPRTICPGRSGGQKHPYPKKPAIGCAYYEQRVMQKERKSGEGGKV